MSSSESEYPESPAIYLFATLSMVFIVLDTADIALDLASLFAIPCLFVTTVISLGRTPSWFRKYGKRGLLPLAMSVLAFPVGIAIAIASMRLQSGNVRPATEA